MAKKTKKSTDLQPASGEPESEATPETKIVDPIGDETDGEAAVAIEPAIEATTETEPADKVAEDSEPEIKSRPPVKLERLQKILAQAGVASRRKAEEMIEQGRVQINGKIVTVLGTKADAARDHIRVDGKLLQGSERLRYFVLNKPRGFVTTVKDPEGRPTVMQFFEKINERLYPVGRLDYMSEGLLVVTNDGELANRLTRAAAGVEKTYLVKVAGQPTESELDILRSGVSIERGKPGSGQVRTSPARIRQVRQGDNPWYEVVLIEGRNRELRKMFESVGHFVEKIRRVGYGPLVLDQEPGNLRELDPEELAALRAAAEGKLRTPKSKELRRRNAMDAAGLPTVAPRPTIHPRPVRPFVPKSFEDRPAPVSGSGPRDYRPKKSFGTDRPSRPARDFGSARPAWKKDDRPHAGKPFRERPAADRTFEDKLAASRGYGAKPGAGKTYGDRPAAARTYGAKPYAAKPYGDKPSAGRSFPAKPAWKRPESEGRPPYKRPSASRPTAPRYEADEVVNLGPRTPSRLQIEPILESDRPSRPSAPAPRPDRPYSGRSGPGRSSAGYSGAGRSSSSRPFRGEGGLARPFTTSSGKPRAGGARPSSKPEKSAPDRSYGAGSSRGSAPRTIDPRTGSGYRPAAGPKRSFGGPSTGFKRPGSGPRPSGSSRPFTPREGSASESRPRGSKPYPNSASRAERQGGTGWKPKTRYGGSGKPASAGSSKPGGFSKSGYKGKPSGPKRSGAPGGKKRR
ncbi:MAG: pseudouridine synthase [Terracidiphilus sp.]